MANEDLYFLGGTCGNNDWRDKLIAALQALGINTDQLFNPVVADWNDEAAAREELVKNDPRTIHIYYLANPLQDGSDGGIVNPTSEYSWIEATMALYDKYERTLVVFDYDDVTAKHDLKDMKQTERRLRERFGDERILNSFDELVDLIADLLI